MFNKSKYIKDCISEMSSNFKMQDSEKHGSPYYLIPPESPVNEEYKDLYGRLNLASIERVARYHAMGIDPCTFNLVSSTFDGDERQDEIIETGLTLKAAMSRLKDRIQPPESNDAAVSKQIAGKGLHITPCQFNVKNDKNIVLCERKTSPEIWEWMVNQGYLDSYLEDGRSLGKHWD